MKAGRATKLLRKFNKTSCQLLVFCRAETKSLGKEIMSKISTKQHMGKNPPKVAGEHLLRMDPNLGFPSRLHLVIF